LIFCDPITFNATKVNKTIFIESFLNNFNALLMDSWMRRTVISIHQPATKTTVFGRAAIKQMSDLNAWLLNARSSLRVLWYRLVFVLVAKVDCSLLMKRQKWMQNIMWGDPHNILLLELFANCKRLLPAGFIFQQDGAPTHTDFLLQDWLNLNCPGSLKRTNGPKLSRFEPSGLSRVGCYAGEIS